MDMLNFHKYTVGRGYIPEFGCSDEKEHFDNLYKWAEFITKKEVFIVWTFYMMIELFSIDWIKPGNTIIVLVKKCFKNVLI